MIIRVKINGKYGDDFETFLGVKQGDPLSMDLFGTMIEVISEMNQMIKTIAPSVDTAMHDMGSLGRMLQIDLPRDWASLALHRDVWRGVVSRC